MIVNTFCKISKNIYMDGAIPMHNSRKSDETKAERMRTRIRFIGFMDLERKLSIRESIG